MNFNAVILAGGHPNAMNVNHDHCCPKCGTSVSWWRLTLTSWAWARWICGTCGVKLKADPASLGLSGRPLLPTRFIRSEQVTKHYLLPILTLLFVCAYINAALCAGPPSADRWEPIAELTDEFEGNRLDSSKWHDHNPTWNGRKPGFFSKNNVFVRDGRLHLLARVENLKEAPKGYHTFTTAAVKSQALVRYGYFEIKCRPMKSKASSAFWFYSSTKEEWTEIDVFEICGVGDDWKNVYNMNAHVFHTPIEKKHWSKGAKWKAPFDFVDEYHVYALEWGREVIRWRVDGKVVRELKNTHWHQPLHMNFDSETMPEWFGLPEKGSLPSTFSIEYVRSWKKTDNAEP